MKTKLRTSTLIAGRLVGKRFDILKSLWTAVDYQSGATVLESVEGGFEMGSQNLRQGG